MHCPWFGSWGMFPGMLIPLLVFAAVIYSIVKGVGGRGSSYAERHESHRESPLDILKRRYAKGEINQEEFDRMKKETE